MDRGSDAERQKGKIKKKKKNQVEEIYIMCITVIETFLVAINMLMR